MKRANRMDFGRKMPFFPLDCGKMSAENMIFMCRNKNRSAESEKRISADWMWKFVKTIFSRVVGREKLARNGLFVSIWAFRMCKHGLTKCRTGALWLTARRVSCRRRRGMSAVLSLFPRKAVFWVMAWVARFACLCLLRGGHRNMETASGHGGQNDKK